MHATILIELGKMSCGIHHEPPVLELSEGKLHVTTCCADFHALVDAKFLELSQKLINGDFQKQ